MASETDIESGRQTEVLEIETQSLTSNLPYILPHILSDPKIYHHLVCLRNTLSYFVLSHLHSRSCRLILRTIILLLAFLVHFFLISVWRLHQVGYGLGQHPPLRKAESDRLTIIVDPSYEDTLLRYRSLFQYLLLRA